MGVRRDESSDPAAWLRFATDDLEAARALLAAMGDRGVHVSCYHAQQSVEKALKAWLIGRSQEYPLTHDIRLLLDRCEQAGAGWVEGEREAERLISFAVLGRYPSTVRRVSREEAEAAIRIGASVLGTVGKELNLT